MGVLVGAMAFISVGARASMGKATEDEGFKRLSVDEVHAMVKAKSATIYDNNGRERYEKGHVPTARWLAVADIKPTDLPSDKEKPVVFYCGNEQCGACHQGAKAALTNGYKKVYIMPAGIAGWEKAGKPTEKGEGVAPRVD